MSADLEITTWSVESEQAVLGVLLTSPEKLGDSELDADDFAIESHRLIFASIKRLLQHHLPVDAITVYNDLDERNEQEAVGGLAYLGELAQSMGSAANFRHYANTVRDRATSRRLMVLANDINALATNTSGESLTDRLAHAETALRSLTTRTSQPEPMIASDGLKLALAEIDRLTKLGGAISGIPTGLDALDQALNGLQKKDLIIVAGRPSMGKTSLAMQIAEAAATRKHKVLIFTLEMSTVQLMLRMSAGRAKVPLSHVLQGKMTGEEMARYSQVNGQILGFPLWIEDTGSISVEKLRAIAKRQAVRRGVDLIVVDQLSHIAVKGDNRAQALGDITGALKSLAKELDVPLILACQLNRDSAKSKEVRRPAMTDLRDSGCIEQDADVIMLLHRPSYYDNTENPTAAEIIIAKQRMGERGVVLNVGWAGEYTRFTNHADANAQPAYVPKQAARDWEL